MASTTLDFDGEAVADALRSRPGGKQLLAASMAEARQRTMDLVAGFRDDHLAAPALPILSPPVWDLGHMANFEDLWLVQRMGHSETGDGCNDRYNAVLHPRPDRPKLDLLDRDGCREYFDAVRRRVLAILHEDATDTGADAAEALTRDGFVYWLLVLHEHQHQETLLQTIQCRAGDYAPWHRRRKPAARPTPPCWVHIPAGAHTLGRAQSAGVYDNEAPAHRVDLPAFALASHPVTCGEYLRFVESGYPAKHFSEGGRAWLQDEAHHAPLHWYQEGDGQWWRRGITGNAPVAEVSDELLCHVSFWEAEAYANWAGARLPTEAEWEAAAAGHPVATTERAVIDHTTWGPCRGDEQSQHGDLRGLLGGVWEWTVSRFEAYPGTQWFPYPDYSDRWYGGDFRVLRGGSWATRATIATPWFRNWDLPQRRQIFSGIRLARDGAP